MTDRDAAKEILFRLRLMHPEITIVWADSGHAGQLVTWAEAHSDCREVQVLLSPFNAPRVVPDVSPARHR